jgi:hypothetical protein
MHEAEMRTYSTVLKRATTIFLMAMSLCFFDSVSADVIRKQVAMTVTLPDGSQQSTTVIYEAAGPGQPFHVASEPSTVAPSPKSATVMVQARPTASRMLDRHFDKGRRIMVEVLEQQFADGTRKIVTLESDASFQQYHQVSESVEAPVSNAQVDAGPAWTSARPALTSPVPSTQPTPAGSRDAAYDGCTQGDGAGCTIYGNRIIAKDGYIGLNYLIKGCGLKSGAGCASAGAEYLSGINVARDLERADRFFHLGCDLKDVKSCQGLQQVSKARIDEPKHEEEPDYATATRSHKGCPMGKLWSDFFKACT